MRGVNTRQSCRTIDVVLSAIRGGLNYSIIRFPCTHYIIMTRCANVESVRVRVCAIDMHGVRLNFLASEGHVASDRNPHVPSSDIYNE